MIDPRTNPSPKDTHTHAATTTDTDELDTLHQLCREGRLYEIEKWIQEGRPLQLETERPPGRRRWSSALEIALEAGNHALVLLLLCNGYDANRERRHPINLALRSRRFDLLDLLLEWGAEPLQVDLDVLFGTYDSSLFERFRSLGVDLTARHGLAWALVERTSNKPLYGFALRLRKSDPKIQTELNIALGYHAGRGNERGVGLCLWAGADPHAPAPSLWHGRASGEDEEEEEFAGWNAVYRACSHGHLAILEKLGPDPEEDDFEELYRTAEGSSVVQYLAKFALPENVGAVVQNHVRWLSYSFGPESRTWRHMHALEALFEVGVRWEDSPKDEIAHTRQLLLKTDDYDFVRLMKLWAKKDHVSTEVLTELARTPAMRRRMREVGFIPPADDDAEWPRWRQRRPTQSREVRKKCGIELPKVKRPLPRCVQIGRRRAGAREQRMTRAELFERVWATPVSTLAEQWGLSGRGLKKACRRLQVPTPGRGHWPKVRAGKRVRRPRLPKLKPGEAEEIVVWTAE